jgi:hypothetical protein
MEVAIYWMRRLSSTWGRTPCLLVVEQWMIWQRKIEWETFGGPCRLMLWPFTMPEMGTISLCLLNATAVCSQRDVVRGRDPTSLTNWTNYSWRAFMHDSFWTQASCTVTLNCQVINWGLPISHTFGSEGPYEEPGPLLLHDLCRNKIDWQLVANLWGKGAYHDDHNQASCARLISHS